MVEVPLHGRVRLVEHSCMRDRALAGSQHGAGCFILQMRALALPSIERAGRCLTTVTDAERYWTTVTADSCSGEDRHLVQVGLKLAVAFLQKAALALDRAQLHLQVEHLMQDSMWEHL